MRRKFISKSKFQFQAALFASILMLVATLGVWLIMSGAIQTLLLNRSDALPLAEIFDSVHFTVLLVILADVVAVFLIYLFFSHYIAGPLYKIEYTLKTYLETGKAEPITLRRKDYLHDLAGLINEVIFKSKS